MRENNSNKLLVFYTKSQSIQIENWIKYNFIFLIIFIKNDDLPIMLYNIIVATKIQNNYFYKS